MYASALLAFLHHLAAFAVVAALAVEVATFKPPLTTPQARRLQRTDLIFGIAAGAVLLVGAARVAWFEKPPAYYLHDFFFLAKVAAFLLAGLISIYPTAVFLSWSRVLSEGRPPEESPQRTRRVRMCLMLELTLILVILACAALMARGIGYFGR
jgi:putative membrane protein